ncbi:ABC transporter permease [Paenibacillus sp. LMG 31459]|jgi:general nucleoside transport system permease protein|uniref:ABC transporter permease n=1 Tax=Paenibacillus phytohabitans TaxID=2654978 RepID=A0ABX1YWE3_9BACL|nr:MULTISPECIES: ABC transporter permease [Paenibacillus]AIQ32323.1 ABC transporter permease [Paenibacillus sp. FSL P4-0081]KHL92552.1 ABC transporter permease [Paenibacillus sp. IHB B 3415]NOU84083.1 ABC transporter permease [Paenibacillus phytohabitans]OMF22476.1 ABC transporter permease [Paenibacillus sp. FSL H8-0259]
MFRAKYFEAIRTAAVIVIALIIAFLIISLVSDQPLKTIGIFLLEPFSTKGHIGNVIEMAIPLMFTGLAVSLLFRANMFNLGAEGIFYFSGVVASVLAIHLSLNSWLHPLVAILAGSITGALLSAIPGILKAKWNANELVTSLMFNNILFGVGLYLLNYHLRDAKAFANVSFKFEKTAQLSKLFAGTRIHTGLIIVLVLIVLAHLFLYRTKWGYELRMTGVNREFARYSGMKTAKVIILVHLIAGFIAGMGGSVEVLGMYSRFQWTSLPGYGLDGALVAMLAKNNPLSVIVSALFLAYIRIGADLMARLSDVPSEMISIIQAVIILLISAEQFLKFWKNRMLLKEAKEA